MYIRDKRFTLKNINLGKIAGENEASYLSNFEKYFYDAQEYSQQVLEPNIYLIIGRKGTGKSLLAYYICKLHKQQSNRLTEIVSFKNFQFNLLSEFREAERTSREYFSIWQWCLLVELAKLICNDDNIKNCHNIKQLQSFISENLGSKINQDNLIDRSRKLFFKGGVKGLFESSYESNKTFVKGDYIDYLDHLRELLLTVCGSSQSHYLIFLDDLDDRFSVDKLYKESIQSLIYATAYLNKLFFDNQCKVKFVLLLRSDILARFNFSDLNKFKEDNSIYLDWQPELRENSPLFDIILHKIKISLDVKDELDQIYYYLFPDKINQDSFATYVVNHTLARPRDVIKMLSLAKGIYKHHHCFEEIAFKNTKLKYSRYLLEEIKNEMGGHVSDNLIKDAFTLIRNLGKPTFDLNYLKTKKPDYFQEQDGEKKVRELILLLFQFSVIGNIFHDENNPSQVNFHSWAHREDIFEPDFSARFCIHLGLREALRAERQQR